MAQNEQTTEEHSTLEQQSQEISRMLIAVPENKLMCHLLLFSAHFRCLLSWARASELLTEQGYEDDDEVEDVPRLFEVVESQSEQFDDALEREDGEERDVDDLQDVLVRLRHAVELDRHGHHVEHDEHHDENVELLVAGQVVEQQLQPELHTHAYTAGTSNVKVKCAVMYCRVTNYELLR